MRYKQCVDQICFITDNVRYDTRGNPVLTSPELVNLINSSNELIADQLNFLQLNVAGTFNAGQLDFVNEIQPAIQSPSPRVRELNG